MTTQHKGLVLGLLTLLAMLWDTTSYGLPWPAWQTLCILTCMLIWWTTESLPIGVTGLLPLILLPTLNITTLNEATVGYSDPLIFLFLGGFMLALAIEKWELHRRIALNVLKYSCRSSATIVGGIMLATGILSMWMSNTATTVMMLPIGLSIVYTMFGEHKRLNKQEQNLAIALMLGIAFAANIGGMGTLIGTPPNALFAGFYAKTYGTSVPFGQWMLMAIPFVLVLLFICWVLLTKILFRSNIAMTEEGHQKIKADLLALGSATISEQRTALVFLVAVVGWIGKGFLPFTISDTGIALFAAMLLFIVPSGDVKGNTLLAWKDCKNLPWEIILLFGGGLSMAIAVEQSGLLAMIAHFLEDMQGVSASFLLFIIIGISVLLTGFMSNLALLSVLLPVIAKVSESLNAEPLMLLVGATMGVSCAFLLPMSTPPNAIVFGSGYLKIRHMLLAGTCLSVISVGLIYITVRYGIGLLQ